MNVNSKELHRALVQAARVAPKLRPYVRLQAASGFLTVSATDMETYTDTKLMGDGGTFNLLVDAVTVRNLVKNLGPDEVSVAAGPNRTALIGGASLIGTDPETYPLLPEFETLAEFSVAGADFARLITNVQYAAAREETRYAINGVLIELKDDQVRLVATDGRRMAFAETGADGSGECAVIVPERALNNLRMAITKGAGICVTVGDVWVGFSCGNVTMVTRLLDNRFPDYANVIPKNHTVTVDVDRKVLEAAVKRVAVSCDTSSAGIPIMKFATLGSSQLHISAESGEGKDFVDLDAVVSGEGDVAFNPKYVLQALKASDMDRVQLRFRDELTPGIWDMGFTYVLMPISK